jgi:hypothetical protein
MGFNLAAEQVVDSGERHWSSLNARPRIDAAWATVSHNKHRLADVDTGIGLGQFCGYGLWHGPMEITVPSSWAAPPHTHVHA